ncbi:Signal peptidase I [Vagococcus fluvialis bH819]|uniref:Signal peptidase I n=2 Tax=Enterococcaceae TaxID=81852 RepID=A0A1X6WK06_9ENTE|nr:Signal peptidase I [Vagococcus fluvialis bH819]
MQLNKETPIVKSKNYLSAFFWGVVLFIILSSVLMRLNVLQSIVGFNFWVVRTESMTPKINAGDLIVSYKSSSDSYKEGDVIVFDSLDKTIVTHRIIDSSQAGYVTKGDANEERDEQQVAPSQVHGKFVFRIPFLGKIFLMIQTLSGKILLVILIMIGFILKKLQQLLTKEKEEGYHEGKNMVE